MLENKSNVVNRVNEKKEVTLDPKQPIYIKGYSRTKTAQKYQEPTILQATDTKKKIAFTPKGKFHFKSIHRPFKK